MIDTHAHIDSEDFSQDLTEVILRAREAGVERIFLPATDYSSSKRILSLCSEYPDYLYPMLGLHPEDVKEDFHEQLTQIKNLLEESLAQAVPIVAIGEVGLDFYWSREYEKEQIEAFREQVEWSIALHLPLMLHCRKAQNEMVRILREYEKDLVGGVFHCFTGNAQEARELLLFDNFVLGIGGVLTFKKSPLPEVLPKNVPLSRIVLETDSPYMAPVPMRGKRNESSFLRFVLQKLALSYDTSEEIVEQTTTENAQRLFLSPLM